MSLAFGFQAALMSVSNSYGDTMVAKILDGIANGTAILVLCVCVCVCGFVDFLFFRIFLCLREIPVKKIKNKKIKGCINVPFWCFDWFNTQQICVGGKIIRISSKIYNCK